jgi:hypothetical protein
MSHSFFVSGEQMFVYLKQPMGCMSRDGYNFYGRYYCRGAFGPTSVPKDYYLKNRDVLEEMEITSDWLVRKFNRPFPQVSFKPSTFWQIDFYTTVEIARALGIDYKWKANREYTDVEKRALRRSIMRRIEGMDEPD